MLCRNAFIQLRGQLLSVKSNFKVSGKSLTTRRGEIGAPEVIFVEKCEEHPVIVMSEQDDVDIIGAPCPLSNLRPIIRKKFLNETSLQKQLRLMQDTTQLWNQEFWTNHNASFAEERRAYIKRKGTGQQLSAEEMSEFYKEFLDQNWEVHVRYNIEWYQRNFVLLILALRVALEKVVFKLR